MQSAIDGQELEELIDDAASGGPISPAKFTELLMYDLRDLEDYANVKAFTAERDQLASP